MRRLNVVWLLCGLTFALVLHDLKLVHTDLKPENILLVHNDYRLATVASAGGVGSKVRNGSRVS